MYLFAHLFSGALLGLAFLYLVRDRRFVPVCIFGALLPDLLDKPLAIIFPAILCTSRTIGHSLIFLALMIVAGLVLWYERRTLLGLAFACSVLSHQILDSMWNLAATWYFPLLGPFPVIIITNYVGHSLWLEFASPSELVFALASGIIIAAWYPELVANHLSSLNPRIKNGLRVATIWMLGGMGVFLVVIGLNQEPGSFFAPEYSPLTSVMAGLLALCGAMVLVFLKSLRCFKEWLE